MIRITEASPEDVDAFVALESKLFAEDAAQHDRFADPTWPAREGHADFAELAASPDSIVLLAWSGDAPIAMLAGYLAQSSPTRQPVRYAVLRSMYVTAAHRRSGVASELIEQFVSWARSHGAAEAHVNHYAANDGAAKLYAAHGFAANSLLRVLPLD